MYLTPQYDLPFTHPQVIHHPPPGHWSTSAHPILTPPLIPTPTPPPFYVSPTPTPTPQHAHPSTYTTCIDCNHPPSFDPDYGITEAITLSCSHYLCFTCWDALLLKLNDMDALRAPRLALGPMCHVCPLETIRCSPCEADAVPPPPSLPPSPERSAALSPFESPPSLFPFPRRMIDLPFLGSPPPLLQLPPATPPDSPPPSFPPSPAQSDAGEEAGFQSETELPQEQPAWRTRSRRSANPGSSSAHALLPPEPPPTDDPHELLPSLTDPSEMIANAVEPDPFDSFPTLQLLPPFVPPQSQPPVHLPTPIRYYDLISNDTQRSLDDKPFICKVQECWLRAGPGHVSFATAGLLKTHLASSHKPVTRIPPEAFNLQGIDHLASSHKPVTRIPPEAFNLQGIVICPHCPTLYTQQGTQGARLATHIAKHHASSTAAPGQSAALPPVPNVPLHAPDKDPYLVNLAFFESIDLSSPKLHEVYNKAIRWPARATDALDVTVDKFLHHHLSNLDETAPMAAVLLTPRMLLHPPPPGLSRNLIADELILRVRVLENGGAKVLSDRNDWLAHASPSDTWRVLDSDEVNVQIAKTVERLPRPKDLAYSTSLPPCLHLSTPSPLHQSYTSPRPTLTLTSSLRKRADICRGRHLGAATLAMQPSRMEPRSDSPTVFSDRNPT